MLPSLMDKTNKLLIMVVALVIKLLNDGFDHFDKVVVILVKFLN
jgi:hypothetical protein